MSAHVYIDTRPGAGGAFTPPPEVSDYHAWLLRAYHAHRGPLIEADGRSYRMSLGGAHQAITAALHAAAHGTRITFLGPHREHARAVLRQIEATTR